MGMEAEHMGDYYYLVRHSDKAVFALDKVGFGVHMAVLGWGDEGMPELDPDFGVYPPERLEGLEARLRRSISESSVYRRDFSPEEIEKWVVALAPALRDFLTGGHDYAWRLDVDQELGEWIRQRGYRVVETIGVGLPKHAQMLADERACWVEERS